MKFTLTYDGELASNGSKQKKWEIRHHLSPQLQELWEVDRTLKAVLRHRYVPMNTGFFILETHHTDDDARVPELPRPAEPYKDLCESIERGGRKFQPLIRRSFNLLCGLKIQFLRKEQPGKVYQGGDLDNRLKTLFDALQVPDAGQVVADQTVDDPIYCLLEDDALISSLEVTTHRLLSRPNASVHEVRLVIEVDVRVIEPRTYNQIFLGD